MAQPVPRLRLVLPLVAVPIISVGYSVVIFAITSATQPGVTVPDPIGVFIPGAIYDTILALVVGPLAVTLHDRRAVTERMDW
jgi:hypothetical protein